MPVRSTILIAHNPKAGSTDREALLEQLALQLKITGFDVLVSADLAEIARLATEIHERKMLHAVVSAGGDGTVAAVAERVGPETCIAVFPLGTENLLAKWLHATTDIEAFCRAVRVGRSLQMDAATANGRLVLITIGVGFDAEVVRQVHQNRRGHITKWNYLGPLWSTFWNYPFPRLEIEATDWQSQANAPQVLGLTERFVAWFSGRKVEQSDLLHNEPKVWLAPWLFIANLPNYAGGTSIIPLADPCDGMLDVATFAQGGRWRGLLYALKLLLRKHPHCPDYFTIRAKRIVVQGPGAVGYQVDGDFGGHLPLEIEILPKRIRLLQF